MTILFALSFIFASLLGRVEIVTEGSSSVSSDNPIPQVNIVTKYTWPCDPFISEEHLFDDDWCWWIPATGQTGT